MNNNNSVAVIIVGLLGFMAIAITGKWLLDSHDDCERHEHHRDRIEINSQPIIPQQQQQQPTPQVIVTPPAQPIVIGPYPQTFPQYHNRNEFWMGYSDGWHSSGMRQNCPEYIQGYQIGVHDRRCNQPYYHDQYFPPGLTFRLPSFSFNIR